MIIVHERKRKEFISLFPTNKLFIEYLKINYSSLNFDNKNFENKINNAYLFFVETVDVIQYVRLTRNLHRGFSFKYKNSTKVDFWIERGWSESESVNIIKEDIIKRSKKQSETKKAILKDKNVFFDNGELKEFRFISGIYFSANKSICSVCNSDLTLKRINKNNIESEFYYEILGCSNDNCKTHHMKKNDKYKSFLPEKEAGEVIEKNAKNIRKKNILSIESWVNKGYSEEEAKKEIFKIQSDNSKKRINPFIPTKENLKKYGYSDLEIEQICLSPVQEEFWIKKGLTKEEAKNKVGELQKKNSLKFVQKRVENPDAYSAITQTQIGYWVNKGFSEVDAKEKLRERQSTFSLEKCIEKHGEEGGGKFWNDRQFKWKKSLLENGNLKSGYSKISQELFDEIIKKYEIDKLENIFYATKKQEYFLSMPNNEFFQYDFVDLEKKRIIEYNGDQFHANPKLFKECDFPNPFRKNLSSKEIWSKDKRKKEVAEEKGFEVMVIWDSEYRCGNKQKVINKCLNFLEIKK